MLGRMAFYKSFSFFERRLDYLFTQCQRIQKQLEAMQRYEFDVAADEFNIGTSGTDFSPNPRLRTDGVELG
jgi:hypothetical protein